MILQEANGSYIYASSWLCDFLNDHSFVLFGSQLIKIYTSTHFLTLSFINGLYLSRCMEWIVEQQVDVNVELFGSALYVFC